MGVPKLRQLPASDEEWDVCDKRHARIEATYNRVDYIILEYAPSTPSCHWFEPVGTGWKKVHTPNHVVRTPGRTIKGTAAKHHTGGLRNPGPGIMINQARLDFSR